MDPLSITAAIIAILGALQKCVELAKSLWNRTKDLDRLSLELNRLTSLSLRLQNCIDGIALHPRDLVDLDKARRHLESAHDNFNTCLGRASKGRLHQFLKLDHLVLGKRKNALRKFKSELTATEKDLNSAFAVLMLSSILTLRRAMTGANTSNVLLQATLHQSASELDSTTSQQRQSPKTVETHGEVNEGNSAQATADGALTHEFLHVADHVSRGISDIVSLHTPCPSPASSSLELSSTFYPEQYVGNGSLNEHCTIYAMTEISRTYTHRLDKYHLVVATDARHFKRVIVRVKRPLIIGSEGSHVPKTDTFRQLLPTAFGRRLPEDMLKQLVLLIKSSQINYVVTSVNLEMIATPECDALRIETARSHIYEDLEAASYIDTSNEIPHMSCQGTPIYDEGEIVRLAPAPQGFLAAIGPDPYLEQRNPFSGNWEHADVFMDGIESLQRAQGCRYVAKFRGVIRDESMQLSSYLLDLPSRGPIRRTLYNALRAGVTIPWTRREKWVRQILEAYRDIHKRGLTVGDVCQLRNVWLDGDDNVVITILATTTLAIGSEPGRMPPELRQAEIKDTLREPSRMKLNCLTDMFQLGLFIWSIAEQTLPEGSAFCRTAGCSTFPRHECRAAHADPVALPSCDPAVPGYINEMVSHCRREYPPARKSARELLLMLPPRPEDEDASINTAKMPLLNGRDLVFIRCNECGQITSERYFHCNICRQGNLDLCPGCVIKGATCMSTEHQLLQQTTLENGQTVSIAV